MVFAIGLSGPHKTNKITILFSASDLGLDRGKAAIPFHRIGTRAKSRPSNSSHHHRDSTTKILGIHHKESRQEASETSRLLFARTAKTNRQTVPSNPSQVQEEDHRYLRSTNSSRRCFLGSRIRTSYPLKLHNPPRPQQNRHEEIHVALTLLQGSSRSSLGDVAVDILAKEQNNHQGSFRTSDHSCSVFSCERYRSRPHRCSTSSPRGSRSQSCSSLSV